MTVLAADVSTKFENTGPTLSCVPGQGGTQTASSEIASPLWSDCFDTQRAHHNDCGVLSFS